MANLGSAQTNKFNIGTAELRIGVLGSAGQLVQSNSVGLIDNATVSVSQNSVDLQGGFPKKIVDTAIVSQESSLTATLREYSKRNIDILLGNAAAVFTTQGAADRTLVVSSASTTSVTVTTGDGANWAAGDIIVVHSATDKASVSVCRVDSVAADTLTLDPGTPLTFAPVAGDKIFRAEQSAIGAVDQTNYFAVSLVQVQRNGSPAVWNFWKAAISSGMEYGTNAEDFGSTELTIKLLEPSAADYAAGGPLNHLANIIPKHPTGMYAAGADFIQ